MSGFARAQFASSNSITYVLQKLPLMTLLIAYLDMAQAQGGDGPDRDKKVNLNNQPDQPDTITAADKVPVCYI